MLVTLCELTPWRCSVGEALKQLEDTASHNKPQSWYMWCGMKSSSLIIRPDSTRVRTMWSILSQSQTLASFVRMFCLINCDKQSPECVKQQLSLRLLPVLYMAVTNHTHPQHSFMLYSKCTPARPHRNTHTLAWHSLTPITHTYNILPCFESICGSTQSPLHKLFVINERARRLLLWWSSERIKLCQWENSTDVFKLLYCMPP